MINTYAIIEHIKRDFCGWNYENVDLEGNSNTFHINFCQFWGNSRAWSKSIRWFIWLPSSWLESFGSWYIWIILTIILLTQRSCMTHCMKQYFTSDPTTPMILSTMKSNFKNSKFTTDLSSSLVCSDEQIVTIYIKCQQCNDGQIRRDTHSGKFGLEMKGIRLQDLSTQLLIINGFCWMSCSIKNRNLCQC